MEGQRHREHEIKELVVPSAVRHASVEELAQAGLGPASCAHNAGDGPPSRIQSKCRYSRCLATLLKFLFVHLVLCYMDKRGRAQGASASSARIPQQQQDAPPSAVTRPRENPFRTLGITFDNPATRALIENGGPLERGDFGIKVVRRLAPDHHPDKAVDEADRQRRVASM